MDDGTTLIVEGRKIQEIPPCFHPHIPEKSMWRRCPLRIHLRRQIWLSKHQPVANADPSDGLLVGDADVAASLGSADPSDGLLAGGADVATTMASADPSDGLLAGGAEVAASVVSADPSDGNNRSKDLRLKTPNELRKFVTGAEKRMRTQAAIRLILTELRQVRRALNAEADSIDFPEANVPPPAPTPNNQLPPADRRLDVTMTNTTGEMGDAQPLKLNRKRAFAVVIAKLGLSSSPADVRAEMRQVLEDSGVELEDQDLRYSVISGMLDRARKKARVV